MDKSHADRAAELCREAATLMENCGTYRLRILIQMVRAELEQEKVAQANEPDHGRSPSP